MSTAKLSNRIMSGIAGVLSTLISSSASPWLAAVERLFAPLTFLLSFLLTFLAIFLLPLPLAPLWLLRGALTLRFLFLALRSRRLLLTRGRPLRWPRLLAWDCRALLRSGLG